MYKYIYTYTYIYIYIYINIHTPKPLSDQFPVRVCSCPLCIINRL